jgi:DNA-binding response OmpR family regulator
MVDADVIVLDIALPGVSDIEILCTALRAGRTRATRVLMFSLTSSAP